MVRPLSVFWTQADKEDLLCNMGLNDLVPEDAGDGKGGRPPETGGDRPTHNGNAYTESDDNEEYWQEVYDENVEDSPPSLEEISQMSSYAAVRPATVKQKLTEYNIYEFTQDDVRDDDPIHMKRGKWAGGPEEEVEKKKPNETSTKSTGLMSLIDDAKK